MKTAWLLALSLLFGMPAGADTPPRYKMTVLPLSLASFDRPDNFNFGGGIKGAYVVGMHTVHKGRLSDERAALWQQGHPLLLLDTTPVTPHTSNSSLDAFLTPTALNRRGACVGYSYYTFSGAGGSGQSATASFWQAGKSARLPEDYRVTGRADLAGFPADTNSVALAINDNGDIVGSVSYNPHRLTADDSPASIAGTHAFLRRSGKIKLLWPGIALDINNRGWIAGIRDTSGDLSSTDSRGILWRNGHSTLFKMQPVAISDMGEIAGNLPLTDETGKACVWRQGRITLLSKQISHAEALNNRGQVVGSIKRATLWQEGRTYNLNRCVALPKGWVLDKAIGINDSGWIIGEGSVYKTPKDAQAVKSFTFLLTPRSFLENYSGRRRRASMATSSRRTLAANLVTAS